MTVTNPKRRLLLGGTIALGTAAAATAIAVPVWAQVARRTLPDMTEGPFYPPRRWRALQTDWDADLTRVRNSAAASTPELAQGEHLGLDVRVTDAAGKAIDRVEFEIWQCDANAVYRHPSEREEARMDKGFQGFGSAFTSAVGAVSFRTIKPVPYPGRTPHIHVKLRHPAFGELTSQLFIAGNPGNARDGIWRRLGPERQTAVDMQLMPAGTDEQRDGLRWRVQHAIVADA